MTRTVVPLVQLQTRVREHGRIRLGKQIPVPNKPGKTMPTSIETFRFTSADKVAIEQIAAELGGTVKPFDNPKASPRNQWEVETPAASMKCWLPPEAFSQWYELWEGGGIQRRCDGVDCEVPVETADGVDMRTGPCICERNGKMLCKAYSRLNVIIPSVRFGGVWRLETKGWNAAHELPGIVEMLERMADSGKFLQVVLSVERRSKMVKGKLKTFVVPTVTLDVTASELVSGSAVVGPALAAPAPLAALPSAEPVAVTAEPPEPVIDQPDLDVLCDQAVLVEPGLKGVAGQDLMRALIATLKPGATQLPDLTDAEYDRLVDVVLAVIERRATATVVKGRVRVEKV